MFCGQGLKWSGKLSCTWSGGGVRHGRKETRKTASHKKQKQKRQPCCFDLCVSFPSPKHDSDRSSGKRSRVLLHSAASSFRVACQTPQKGRSLRCVVEWSIDCTHQKDTSTGNKPRKRTCRFQPKGFAHLDKQSKQPNVRWNSLFELHSLKALGHCFRK